MFQLRKSDDPRLLINQAIAAMVNYDKSGQFRKFVKDSLKTNDSASLPEGSLISLMPTIYDMQYGQFWADYIPINPFKAAGTDKLVYQRVSYTGELVPVNAESSDNKGRLDVGTQNIEVKVQRYAGHFEISDLELDRLARFAATSGSYGVAGTINLMQEKRQSAIRAWAAKRDEIICNGVTSLGIFGFMNHPDIDHITLDAPINAARTADQNIAALAAAAQSIVARTKGTFRPSTLVLPTATMEILSMQRLGTSPSDKSTLGWFQENRRTVMFDGGKVGNFEVAESARLDDYSSTEYAAVMFCRSAECVEQAIPKDLTYKDPIQTNDGYRINVHGDIAGIAYKRGGTAVRLVYSKS
jgi:hypothetical protein